MSDNTIYFTETQIKDIYNSKVKKPSDYFSRQLPKCPVKMWNYNWQNRDAPRCFCLLDFIIWINKYNLNTIKTLNITCTGDPELEFINAEKINVYSYLYETNTENDLHKLANKEKCDFFLFNQTIEHLYNPLLAVKNIYNNLNDNGYVFTSVPTVVIPHDTPFHFANWTPMGLAMLFSSAGFEIKEIGYWGNINYIHNAYGKVHDFPDVFKCGSHNEETNPCGCWILAQKVVPL
jgi:SAM-dependent methyltransferase